MTWSYRVVPVHVALAVLVLLPVPSSFRAQGTSTEIVFVAEEEAKAHEPEGKRAQGAFREFYPDPPGWPIASLGTSYGTAEHHQEAGTPFGSASLDDRTELSDTE